MKLLSLKKFVQPSSEPPGCLVQFAEAVKKVVHIPVITVGRINNPVLAESILQEGKADLVAMGRALIADPEMPNKAREGRLGDIRGTCRSLAENALKVLFEKTKGVVLCECCFRQ